MKFCGLTVNFMQKITICYGNEYVLTIKEKNVYRDNNVLLIRSTDERASCLSRSSTLKKNN